MTVSLPEQQYARALEEVLAADLDFREKSKNSPLHNFHSFPAKFPPELPRAFILRLTSPLETVLDPMSGSGTTVVEAYLANRQAIGFDIDQLALLMARVKTSSSNVLELHRQASAVIAGARQALLTERDGLERELNSRWDIKTKTFVDYWFLPETQLELMALVREAERVSDMNARDFLAVTLSSIIITKSGGVSLAMDLGHTRPHKVPVLADGANHVGVRGKRLRSPIVEFEKRLKANLAALGSRPESQAPPPQIHCGFAQQLPLRDDSVDLIVTSPPYAANAIDYMRAHKFSLVWLGCTVENLMRQKSEYIGNHKVKDAGEPLPALSQTVVSGLAELDRNKAVSLHSYFCDMRLAIKEMLRVLRPGKAAIMVVGDSLLRGKDTRTGECLAEIGQSLGLRLAGIRQRNIDRDRRMMPVSSKVDLTSVVQQRMHREHVIGFYKHVN